MVDLGRARRFLGMKIDNTIELGFSLYQTAYTESLLRRFKMTCIWRGYSYRLPCISRHRRKRRWQAVDQTEYLAIVGSLMYAAIGTRPDISYAVGSAATTLIHGLDIFFNF